MIGKADGSHVPSVIHPVAQYANDKNPRFVGFEEDVETATYSHPKSGPEVIAAAGYRSVHEQALHRVTQCRHVLRCVVLPPRPRGIAAYRLEVRGRISVSSSRFTGRQRTRRSDRRFRAESLFPLWRLRSRARSRLSDALA